jgi:hypothetical protein
MEIEEKIQIEKVIIQDDLERYILQLKELKEKHTEYAIHYSILNEMSDLEKKILIAESKLEILNYLKP